MSNFETRDSYYKEETSQAGVINYPCLVLEPKGELESFRVEALKSIVMRPKLLEKEGEVQYYVYLKMPSGTQLQIGVILGDRMKQMLDSRVLDFFNKEVYLSEDTVIQGELLYGLCVLS